MQVSALETDFDLFIHVLNALTCPLDQKLRAFKMHTKVGARRLEVRFLVRFLGMQPLTYTVVASYLLPSRIE